MWLVCLLLVGSSAGAAALDHRVVPASAATLGSAADSSAAAAAAAAAAGELLPGVADVCAHMDPSETCSPEICDLQPHTTVRLEAKTYFQNTSVVLPEGANLIGAGINKTIVISCGAPSSGRRGFILGNDTYLGHYTWQGLQASRGNFDAAVGTPGCLQPHNDGYPKHPFVCTGGFIPGHGDGAGVQVR